MTGIPHEAGMKKFVDYGHSLGTLVSFYEINGFTDPENQGWTPEYDFGSKAAAEVRWESLIKAHADFIATDQYEMSPKPFAPRAKHHAGGYSC